MKKLKHLKLSKWFKPFKRPWRVIWRYNWLSLALAAGAVALVLQFSGHSTAANWVLGVTALAEVIPLFIDMTKSIQAGSYGIDILAATAIVFSVVLNQQWAAIVIAIMLTGGQSLEAYAQRRSHAELDALLKSAPHMAHVIRTRKVVEVKASEVHAGDRIIIKPGEIVPVDATITEGSSSFDESNLTGESLPQTKNVGDLVLSGSVNQAGEITAKAVHSAADSQYQQIVALVKSAAASRAPFVRLADRYSIPFTIMAYIIAGAAWYIGGSPIRFLEVIVVATPCPLLLAAPIALVSGMARASKHGIIVKTGSALEKLAEAKTVAFDKTGTLTHGDLAVTAIKTNADLDENSLLVLAASLEQSSNHVLAQTIVSAALERGLHISRAKHVQEEPGRGLRAQLKGQVVLVGNYGLMLAHDVTLPKKFQPDNLKQTAVYIAADGQLAGVLLLNDTIRPESSTMLKQLYKLGIKQTMLITGDSAAAARPIAKLLGIKKMYAEALPGEKLQILEAATERPLAYVGDGVNDAPSLTAADVGIAIGARGNTAASEAADLVIMPNDISHVAIALSIAKRTFKIARQSILVGIGLSLVLMIIFSFGYFPPLMGAVLQEVVDVVVIFNALRAHSGSLPTK